MVSYRVMKYRMRKTFPQRSEVRSVWFADFGGDGHTDSFHVVSPYYRPGWGAAGWPEEILRGYRGG
jgi:hypothetical protein